jgi:hypothetical protein
MQRLGVTHEKFVQLRLTSNQVGLVRVGFLERVRAANGLKRPVGQSLIRLFGTY